MNLAGIKLNRHNLLAGFKPFPQKWIIIPSRTEIDSCAVWHLMNLGLTLETNSYSAGKGTKKMTWNQMFSVLPFPVENCVKIVSSIPNFGVSHQVFLANAGRGRVRCKFKLNA